MVYNTTAQVTLNKMDTSLFPTLNSLIKTIWDWCIANVVWLAVARIPGKNIIQADYGSRKLRHHTEWCLLLKQESFLQCS